jgi:D-ribose pyranose/furanose isomerase RbsD
MKKVTKLFNIDVKSVDEENRRITFCFSDDKEDRMGEIVDQASWDVKNYMNNPLILFGHDSSIPENILGQGTDLQLNIGGKSFVTAQFDEAEINPRADMVFRQLVKRTLRAVSAGFINHTTEKSGDTPVLKDNELLEISIVPIPANPRAIALALQDGSMSRKDALYLKRSMQDELALIEKQLIKSEIGDLKEKDVEELQTQITQLTSLVTSVVESVSAIRTDVETLKPVEETEEAKTAREAQEASDEAAADQKVIDNKAEADQIAADAAKDGEIDQSGAEKNEIDENAELTPELQEQIDAQLAESMQAKE